MKNILSKHNSYDDFCRCTKDAYEVAGELGVTVCTYCDEQYIFTLPKEEDKSPTRPEFDHFIGKNLDPSKALELENLVPSCHICNSNLKHNKEFKDETHLNPYKDDFDSILKFQAILN